MREKCDNKEAVLNLVRPFPRALGYKSRSDMIEGDITEVRSVYPNCSHGKYRHVHYKNLKIPNSTCQYPSSHTWMLRKCQGYPTPHIVLHRFRDRYPPR